MEKEKNTGANQSKPKNDPGGGKQKLPSVLLEEPNPVNLSTT